MGDDFWSVRKALVTPRSAAGGGVASPIDQNPYMSPAPQTRGAIEAGGTGWFDPLQPMSPTAPPSVAGRAFDFQAGYNLSTQPRPYSPITYWHLRSFAENYDIMRLIIETRKDQMSRLRWNVVYRDPTKNKEAGNGQIAIDPRITTIETFMRRPDREHFWHDWLRMLLEDLLVIDAPTIYRRRTRGGQLFALQIVDGATIKRVLDPWGRTPASPAPAYQQILKGLPAINYTTDDMYYMPRNVRIHSPFGYSPVEQSLMTINIALRRQVWQLQSFTEGNIPEALIGVPDTWTPDQIRMFQDWFDTVNSGNTAERRRARFVPSAISKSYVQTKNDEMFGAGEEWLVRVMCFAFGVSPQPFIKMMNRATAQTSAEEAVVDGLAPIQNWVKALMDTIIESDFGAPELEFVWAEDQEQDPQTQTTILKTRVSTAIMTPNEARRELGLDPSTAPEADQLVFVTGTGAVPLSVQDQITQKQAMQEAFPPPPAPTQIHVGPDGRQVTPPPEEEQKSDLPGKKNKSSVGGGETPSAGAAAAKLGDAEGVLLRKNALPDDMNHDRPLATRTQRSIAKTIKLRFSKMSKSIASQVKVGMSKLGKADSDDSSEPLTAAQIQQLVDDLDLSGLELISDATEDALATLFADTGRRAIALVGAGSASKLVDQVNERAVDWAEERVGELIAEGGSGNITDTTRDMIRQTITSGLNDNVGRSAIADSISSSYAMSPERAELIASTEVRRANSHGALEGYRVAASTGLSIKKRWATAEDDEVDEDVCKPNADDGPIDLDDTFSSGDDAPPGHPNCRCALLPVVESEDGTEEDDDEDGEGD